MEGFPRSSNPSFSALSFEQLLAALLLSSTPEKKNAAVAAMLKHKNAMLSSVSSKVMTNNIAASSRSSAAQKRNTAVAAMLKHKSAMPPSVMTKNIAALSHSSAAEKRNTAVAAAMLKHKSAMLPSVSSKVMTKNIATTNGQMSLQRQPVYYDFLSKMEKRDRESQQKEAQLSKTKNQPELEEVSTDLKLGYGPCITQKRKSPENFASNASSSCQASGIKRMKLNSDVEKEERHGGDSLKLKLGFDDPWVMRKRIEANEQWFSLFLKTAFVGKRILTACEQKRIEDAIIRHGIEIRVVVWDFDTKSEHQLLLKQRTNGSNVTMEDWINEFVLRRGIKEGDEIGLSWDESNLRFNFSILKRNFKRESSLTSFINSSV